MNMLIVKGKIIALTFASIITAAAFISCGSAIKEGQDYSPNNPPVISGITVMNEDGGSISSKVIEPDTTFILSVAANDPDGNALTYKFSSDTGSFSSKTDSETGCLVVFKTANISGGEEVTAYVIVSDGHGASVRQSVDIGTGKLGPTITMTVSPSHGYIKSSGIVTLSVSANCSGIFQIKPSGGDSIDFGSDMMRFSGSGDAATAVIVGPNSSLSGNIKLPSLSKDSSYLYNDTYPATIVFQDGLYQTDTADCPIHVDDTPPVILSHTPGSGATGVAASPYISIVLSENVNPSSLTGALSVRAANGASGDVSFSSYDSSTRTAKYKVNGLQNAVTYTAEISYITDLAGNTISTCSFSFTTASNSSLSSSKEITSFSINGVSASINGTSITLTIPYVSNVTALVASFTTNGTKVTVNGTAQTTGYTANDFSGTVQYIVTAEDGSTAEYSVTVTRASYVFIQTTGTGVGASETYTFPNTGISFSLITAATAGGTVFPTGVDNTSSATVTGGFSIADSETAYELWSVVYNWAKHNSYRFNNAGLAGSITSGTSASTTDKKQPVAEINWRDAVVWCNALTDYYNTYNGSGEDLDLVYYTDSSYSYPMKESLNSSVSSNAGSQDVPYIKSGTAGNTDMANCTANGFRLPTSLEWEYAARYRGTSSINSVSGYENPYYTKGNSASGGWTYCSDASDSNMNGIVDGKESNDAVSVYGYYWNGSSSVSSGITSTAAVKSKTANALGLYDMSGNLSEWCFDWYSVYALTKAVKGGNFNQTDSVLQIGYTEGKSPLDYSNLYRYGFRFARSK
jgi:formylglycine-generating enzyme required for sulfatase activity